MLSDPVNLLLLPHAGGSAAAFRDWLTRMPTWVRPVSINLPGRGIKYSEPPLTRWASLIDEVMCSIEPYLGERIAIFGQSMGALVGIELAHAIRQRHGRSPVWLGISACIAPARRVRELKWLRASNDEVLAELDRLGGTPRDMLENLKLLELLLPTIRADFHLCGTYARESRSPLDCPLLVLAGVNDEISTVQENVLAWSDETSGRCRIEMIAGGHFFIETARDAVIDLIVADLASVEGRHHA
jgi:surfactin synthase thioesterase subunit